MTTRLVNRCPHVCACPSDRDCPHDHCGCRLDFDCPHNGRCETKDECIALDEQADEPGWLGNWEVPA